MDIAYPNVDIQYPKLYLQKYKKEAESERLHGLHEKSMFSPTFENVCFFRKNVYTGLHYVFFNQVIEKV